MSTLPDWPIDDDIYTGFWINRSLGSFRGATLTLDREVGGLVIAFLALFVGAASRSIWKIIRFLLHVACATPATQDGLHHQRQAILRNTPLAFNTTLSLLQANMVWQNRAATLQQRTLPIAFVALAVSVLSAIGGIFSSKLLTQPNSEVLITGINCGTLPFLTSSPDYEAIMSHQSQKMSEYFAYATQCYGQHAGDCDLFAPRTLPYTIDKHAACPFADTICKSTDKNLLLDTGPIDSVRHLGLNRGPRFTLQHQAHCAPLETLGYTEEVPGSNSAERQILYNYGPYYDQNYTQKIVVNNQKLSWDDASAPQGNYRIAVAWSDSISISTFRMIPELRQTQAMVSVLLLDASDILYTSSTDDPWFSATTPAPNNSISLDLGSPTFLSDVPAGVLGCVTRRVYCNPNLPNTIGCIDGFSNQLIGGNTSDGLSIAWPDADEQSAMRSILTVLGLQGAGYLDTLYALPSAPTLLARNTLVASLQLAALPVDYWQTEREHLFKASLAAIQSMVLDFGRGFWTGDGYLCGALASCRRICHSQKATSLKHYSFSAWTLGLILLVGGFVMLVAMFLEEIVTFLLRHSVLCSKKLRYAHTEWQAGSTLQLQRLAHENLGLGVWSRTDEAIPVTNMGDELAVLDTSNAKHARMIAPSEELGHLNAGSSATQGNTSVKTRTQYLRIPGTEQT